MAAPGERGTAADAAASAAPLPPRPPTPSSSSVPRRPSILGGSIDGRAPPARPDDVGRPPCPLERCPWWSALSFAWLNPLIRLGGQRVLEETDLPALAQVERAERLEELVLVSAWCRVVRLVGWYRYEWDWPPTGGHHQPKLG